VTHEAVNPKKICCFFCAHFWQISKCSVLDSEAKKDCRFFHTAGKTQLPKRLIVGKDRTAGKVLAGKSVYSALLWFVGNKGENASPQPFMKKAGYRFPEKVAVRSERQFGSFLEQDSRMGKIRFSLILPMRESCWGVPSPNPAYPLRGNKNSVKLPKIFCKYFNTPTLFLPIFELKYEGIFFQILSKTVPLHTLFFSY